MSFQQWETKGYGLATDNYDIIDIVKRMLDHAEKHGEVQEAEKLKKCLVNEDGSEADSEGVTDALNDDTNYCPLLYFEMYFNKKYDCAGFMAPSIDNDGKIGLIYEPLYPWQTRAGDRLLTYGEVEQIFTEVAELLNWKIEPDEETFYYCG